jgi:hypothetical protein
MTRERAFNLREWYCEGARREGGSKDRRRHRRNHQRPFNLQQGVPKKESKWIIPHETI